MKISIVGVGLIGGSIALKLKSKGIADFICGIDNSSNHLDEALKLHIIDAHADLENGIRNADLIILAIPVDSARKLLPKILDIISENQTVMDTGSTKAGIVQAVKNHPKKNTICCLSPDVGNGKQRSEICCFRKFCRKSGSHLQ